MIFSFLGVKIDISVPFCIVIAFLLINDKTGLMSASLLAVLFHEAGHLAVMKKLKCQPKLVKLSAAGILICGNSYCTSDENILISLAGPFTNFIFCGLFYLVYTLSNSVLILCFAVVQFAVGLLNLMPVKGLDGGTVLYCILSRYNVNAEFITRFISIVFASAMLVFGTFFAIKNVDNPTLLLLGIYLIVLNVMKK